jgi:hypothetical protein
MKHDGRNSARTLQTLAEDVLASAKMPPRERLFWRQPLRDLKRLVNRDYNKAVRNSLTESDVRALISAAGRVWPRINRQRLEIPSKSEFADISKRLSLHLSTRPCHERDGLALRGFYVGSADTPALAPRNGGIIYLNTAHHPAAVGATFCHEVGHHLATRVLSHDDDGPVHFFFDAAYSAHLDDPVELAADVLVSVAAYPRNVARKMLTGEASPAHAITRRNLDTVLDYLQSNWGIDFRAARQPRHHVIYLAGMVHYAKLRRALLTEYGI